MVLEFMVLSPTSPVLNRLFLPPKVARCQLIFSLLCTGRSWTEEAARALEKAIALAPGDADLHGNLGLALQKSGHAAEAQKEFALAETLRRPQKK